MPQQPPLRLSLRWMLINLGGALLTAGGMWHLQQVDASPWPAAMAMAAGMLLMGTALLQILTRARRARPGTGE